MHPNMGNTWMPSHTSPAFLLASADPALLGVIEPLLLSRGARVEVVLSAQAALDPISGANPPGVLLLDTSLPGMPIGQLLAVARGQDDGQRFPIVLIAGAVAQEWSDRLADGAVDDLIPRSAEPAYWQLRLDLVLRHQGMAQELESLRDAAVRSAQLDRLTGVYNRETLLAMLFRETDRVQRMNSSMSLVLFDIDDFGHWNSRLGADACDDLLCQVAGRTGALLRSYDLLGRPGMDEFLVALPACSPASAMILAERLRVDVFASPFRVAEGTIRLSASFGIAASRGRSPVVVLREAEKALEWAKAAGPESIQCFGCPPEPAPEPVTFLSSTSGDELMAW
jgi:two-component system, cell cycle response regulator